MKQEKGMQKKEKKLTKKKLKGKKTDKYNNYDFIEKKKNNLFPFDNSNS